MKVEGGKKQQSAAGGSTREDFRGAEGVRWLENEGSPRLFGHVQSRQRGRLGLEVVSSRQEVWRRSREEMCGCGERCPGKSLYCCCASVISDWLWWTSNAAASISFFLLILDFISQSKQSTDWFSHLENKAAGEIHAEVDRMDELIWKTEQLPQYAENMQHIVLTITLSWIDLIPELHYPSGKVNVIKWAPLRSSAPLSLSFLLLMQCLQAVPAQLYTALIKLYVIRVQSCYALTQTKYSLFQHKSPSLTLICLYTPMSQISINVKDFLS